ncbi:MAG: energy transducer TonB, partial [Burkholderiaceae bacterium]|nr:energy transducer TonB [Burkholderiaceae bacterium]
MSAHASPPSPLLSRNVVIAGSVVLFHVAALWAIQSGLLRRAVEVIVPAEIIVQLMEPPRVAPPPPPPPQQRPRPAPRAPTPPPAPQPIAIPDPTPAPEAPTGVVVPPAPAPIAPPAPPAPPAP